MADKITKSPLWQSRRRVIKRKSSSRCLDASLSSVMPIDFGTESCPAFASPSVSNPFKTYRSPLKKRGKFATSTPDKSSTLKEIPADWDDSNANDSFSILSFDAKSSNKRFQRHISYDPGDAAELKNYFNDLDDFVSFASKPKEEEVKTSTNVPLDLRLGTKIRIVSKKPFPFMRNTNKTSSELVRLTGTERYEGMLCSLNTLLDTSTDAPMIKSDDNRPPASLLEAASLYYQFPYFPWISMYPRLESLLKSMPKETAPPLAPAMFEGINAQWTEAFDQLYLSWKRGERRSFYVCCPTFTALFTKTNSLGDIGSLEDESVSCFQTGDGLKHVAIVTPTTGGFRQFLRDEGVEYELCDSLRRRLSSTSRVTFKLDETAEISNAVPSDSSNLFSSPVNEPTSSSRGHDDSKDCSLLSTGKENSNSDMNAVDNDDEEENESPNKLDRSCEQQDWLAEIGVSPRNPIRLRRSKSMGGSFGNISSVAAKKDTDVSAIIIKGGALQSFYNMLQNNTRVTRAIAGPHANLPPTLITTLPFVNGQMVSMKKSSQVSKRGNAFDYVLELTGGAVMPHSVQMMAEYVRRCGLYATDEPVTLRVQDRVAYGGLNGHRMDADEWQEVRLEPGKVTWNA